MAANADMEQILTWIGFTDGPQRHRICQEGGFGTMSDFVGVTETDIRNMAESFEKRTDANGRILFGMRRIKWLIGIMHWVQDFLRCSLQPTIAGIADANAFKDALTTAIDRAETRKVEAEQADTVSKAADPGKFKDERKWPDWEPAFVNYLSTIPGVNGVPLSYVVRANDQPDHVTDFGEDFNRKIIACAPLHGTHFRTDARKVHQLLKNYLVAETAEQWTKHLARYSDGRRDMAALRDHYAGEGNASRRIASADRMRESLHYKSERSLPFTTFLDRLQKMFNIYEDEGEKYTDAAKIRELFKRVQHPQLQDTVKALKVRFDMDGLTYTQAANHIAAAVSEMPEYQLARKVSSAQRIRGGGSRFNTPQKSGGTKAPKSGVHMPDGTIFTGFYKNWKELPDDDKQKVIDERKKKQKSGGKRKASEITSMAETLVEMKRQVAELSTNMASATKKENEEERVPDDAGNKFGGRNERANGKRG